MVANNITWKGMNKTIYGPGKSLYYHFKNFRKLGVFKELYIRILKEQYENNKLDLSK